MERLIKFKTELLCQNALALSELAKYRVSWNLEEWYESNLVVVRGDIYLFFEY